LKRKKRLKNSHPETSPSSQPPPPPKKVPAYITIVLLALGLTSYLAVQLSHITYWNQNKKVFFFDQDLPLMTTQDAYYYLRLTRELIDGQYQAVDEKRPGFERPSPVPLIVSVTALLHRTTSIPLERIAFYLPPALGSLMAVILFLWGKALGGRVVALMTSLAGISGVYWCLRSSLGRFDTDCLNPVFAYLIIFLVYRFVTIQNRIRFAYLFASLFAVYLFGLWWIPGMRFGAFLVIFTYSASLFLDSSKVERLLKIGLLIMIAATGFAFALAFAGILPSSLSRYFGPEFEYFGLMTNSSTSPLPNVGQSITELHSLSLRELALATSGNEIPLMVSLAGLIFLFKRRKDAACFLGPTLLFGLSSMVSERFVIFFIPLYAIGIGYLLGDVLLNCSYSQKLRSPVLRWGIWGTIAALLFYPGFYWSTVTQSKPRQTVTDVHLARALAEQPGSQALVWAWWDSGYFLQYFSGKKTIIDGGSQTPERIFITAYPLACKNLVLAENWMRFFAAHPEGDLDILTSRFGDFPKAISFLTEILGNPGDFDHLLGKHGLSDPPFWRQYLFPETETLLYVDYLTLDKSYWWYYYGTWDFERREGTHPSFHKKKGADFSILERDGLYPEEGRLLKVDTVISIGPSGGGSSGVKQYDFKGRDRSGANPLSAQTGDSSLFYEPESAAVINRKTSTAYFLSANLFQSLACRLLFQSPSDTRQFTLLSYIPTDGGAWRLE
jgi:asparagine N-glycosylation enzyme membrane subunit Stt3